MADDRDAALAELEAAGVLVRVGSDDRETPVYALRAFPPGEEGERLKALFDRHIQGRDRLDGAATTR